MNWLTLLAIVVYAFGAYAFASVTLYALWDPAWRSWSKRIPEPGCLEGAGTANYMLMLVSLVWFIVLLLLQLDLIIPSGFRELYRLLFTAIGLTFPPLIMHTTFNESYNKESHGPTWRWKLGYRAVYAMVGVALAYLFALTFDLVDLSWRFTNIFFMLVFSIGFGVAAIYSALTIWVRRRYTPPEANAPRETPMLALYGFMFFVVIGMVLFTPDGPNGLSLLQLVGTSLPLMFIFVGVYQENRFEFFDLFVKRGATMLLTVGLLFVWLWAISAVVEPVARPETRPWIYAILMLPLGLAVPWIHKRLGSFLDNRWLGRRFSTVEAAKHFLAGMQEASCEEELVEAAQVGLAEIFQAPVRVDLGLREAPDLEFDTAQSRPIRLDGDAIGSLHLGRRANDVPYFSEDLSLLDSLADMFSFMLDNHRLCIRKQEHEKRTKELSLQASRSELKALRAQINPHFLFNALNVIAGLIHENPKLADRTVEQLAEVFRYTLRGSQNEWAVLEEELEFVRAYLDVEQARFGDRLQVEFDIAPAALPARIPTMMVQTLVENAIKHGIGCLREGARVVIRAEERDGRLCLQVRDNGPDPGEALERALDRPHSTESTASGGFGLHNIRERLIGHFGEQASLRLRRSADGGQTVASIVMPLTRRIPRDVAAR